MPVDLTRYVPKATRAAKFFDRRELSSDLRLTSADRLYKWLAAGANTTALGASSLALGGSDLVYRGQPNANYGLSSSLFRLCRTERSGAVVEADLVSAEAAILNTMRQEGLGRCMTDLELLQVLQHHGIPTRLVDVSIGPLEALFFAVNNEDAVDGRLFIIRLDARVAGARLLSGSGSELPWHGMSYGPTRARDRWTQTLALVDADPLDPRMRAQRGKFLVGGLNRRTAGRLMGKVPSAAFPDVTSLGINFLNQLRIGNNKTWPATGWTIRIPSHSKNHLCERLASEDEAITPDAMYPPLDEVRRLALSRVREALE